MKINTISHLSIITRQFTNNNLLRCLCQILKTSQE